MMKSGRNHGTKRKVSALWYAPGLLLLLAGLTLAGTLVIYIEARGGIA